MIIKLNSLLYFPEEIIKSIPCLDIKNNVKQDIDQLKGNMYKQNVNDQAMFLWSQQIVKKEH